VWVGFSILRVKIIRISLKFPQSKLILGCFYIVLSTYLILCSLSTFSFTSLTTTSIWWYVAAWDTPVRTTKTNGKLDSVAFLLYSLVTNSRGKNPSEHEDEIDRAGYIVNKMYTSDWNIANDDTVSSVVPVLEVKFTCINFKTFKSMVRSLKQIFWNESVTCVCFVINWIKWTEHIHDIVFHLSFLLHFTHHHCSRKKDFG
jgi:hypothetical protein